MQVPSALSWWPGPPPMDPPHGYRPPSLPFTTPLEPIPPRDTSTEMSQLACRKPLDTRPRCNYCGVEGCWIRSCPRALEDVATGFCARAPDGRIILPTGRFIPRSLPGSYMRDRLLAWHARKQSSARQRASPPVNQHPSAHRSPLRSLSPPPLFDPLVARPHSSMYQPPGSPVFAQKPRRCPASPAHHLSAAPPFPRS
ncbi:hypothetical protein LXA43DRAFT_1098947 [Ganoderma leucocontextum]|nr:hypothetical protein LXA43DRAFT_1098947 [Ganoderma leucocontextum]